MEELFVPATGMAMEEAALVEWAKQPGDSVGPGDVVALIETDKAMLEVTANSAGVLGRHLHAAGAHVPAGQAIAYVLSPGETEPGETVPETTAADAAPEAVHSSLSISDGIGAAVATDSRYRTPHTLSPRRRRMLRDEARPAAAAPSAAPAPPIAPPVAVAPAVPVVPSVEPVDDRARRSREHIGRAVLQSWTTVPHFAVSREVDVTGLTAQAAALRAAHPEVGLTDLLVRVVARGWAALTGTPDPVVGVAVATPRGVVNVSLDGAATLPWSALATRRRAAVDRARRGRAVLADLRPAAVTLSNLGTHGVDWFTGVIPLGQTALVTVGRVRRGVLVDGDGIRLRELMWVTVNLDHRTLDGADGGRLLELFVAACDEAGTGEEPS